MSANQKLNNLLTDMVMQKAIQDKLEQEINPKVNAESNKKQEHKANDDSDQDYDSEEERILQSLRQKRVSQLKSKQNEKAQNRAKGHGLYIEIQEDQFLNVVTKSQFCVVHFYHNDFERCKIVDKHLKEIAYHHDEARIVKINSQKAPFFVGKLAVQVLPTIIMFKNGIAVDKIVGFEELGGTDEFPTLVLSRRIVKSGVLKAKLKGEDGRMVMKKVKGGDDSGSDYDD